MYSYYSSDIAAAGPCEQQDQGVPDYAAGAPNQRIQSSTSVYSRTGQTESAPVEQNAPEGAPVQQI